MSGRILVVEDDQLLARVLRDVLTLDGFEVESVEDGDRAIAAAVKFSPDMVLLDITLPGRSGFDLCQIWRKQQRRVPIIIITARSQKADKLLGLELGADDYITKPFDVEELLARVRAVLRRVLPAPRALALDTKPQGVIRVLCVDQHPLVLEGITSLIGRQPDMTVIATTGSGEEAIELFEEERPDVTVLDLQLPTISGVDVIRTLRAKTPDARVIVVTGYHGEEDVFNALNAGAASYLLNDGFANELVDFIRQVHAGEKPLSARVRALLAERIPDSALTAREIQVIQLVAQGMQNLEIADKLGITKHTVKAHVKNVLFKLDARDRTEAIAVAVRRGIIHLS